MVANEEERRIRNAEVEGFDPPRLHQDLSNLLFKQAFSFGGVAGSAHGPIQSSQRPAKSRVDARSGTTLAN